MRITDLSIYPIKSTSGVHADQFEVVETGLMLDRHWVLIDEDNKAITGRKNAQILSFSSKVNSDHLLVQHGSETIELPFQTHNSNTIEVKIFSSIGSGIEISEQINKWFSDRLKQPCRLAALDPQNKRQIQIKHGGNLGETVGFADMNPILLISEASLEDLNERLETPVSMRNFRPNIVIKGCGPFEEDNWRRIRIGSCEFRVVQKCERCVFTTINPDTFKKDKNSEPLKTLSQYRRTESGGVTFGVHIIPEKLGIIRMGDRIDVIA